MDEEEFLSEEQLCELLNTKYVFDYYVYFDKDDGSIFALSNEVLPQYDTFVQVDFKDIERFFNDTDQHFNFKVVIDNDGVVSFVNKHAATIVKNNIIETIRLTDVDTNTLTIVWTPVGWKFIMNPTFLQHPRAKSLNARLFFYVTKENNINHLLRQLEIQLRHLVKDGTVLIPFKTDHEKEIDNISMFTVPFFETYGMKIEYDKN